MYRKKYYAKKNRSAKPFGIILLLALASVTAYFLLVAAAGDSKNTIISPVVEGTVKQIVDKTLSVVRPIKPKLNSPVLGKMIFKTLGNDRNDYAVAIDNLATGEKYYLNEDKVFDSASLYKLWIMAVAYRQMEKHELSETDVLSDTIDSLYARFDITPDPTEPGDETVTWPVKTAIEQMITISDNDSALLLTEKVGLANVAGFLSGNGFADSRVGTMGSDPVTTARDIDLFFEKLYSGQLADSDDTKEMLDLLKQQQINTKIPLYLPKNIVIAHKTGDLDGFSHDAGIVYAPKGDYIIVVLSDTVDPLAADGKIAQISKEVYDYFYKS